MEINAGNVLLFVSFYRGDHVILQKKDKTSFFTEGWPITLNNSSDKNVRCLRIMRLSRGVTKTGTWRILSLRLPRGGGAEIPGVSTMSASTKCNSII